MIARKLMSMFNIYEIAYYDWAFSLDTSVWLAFERSWQERKYITPEVSRLINDPQSSWWQLVARFNPVMEQPC